VSRTTASRSAIAAIMFGVLSLVLTTLAGSASGSSPELVVSQPAAPSRAPADTPAPDRAHGVVWDGLEPGAAACPHGYAVRGVPEHCTHGPDPAPDGVDVRRARSTSELLEATAEGTGATSNAAVPCYGDGASGNRVQVVYAHSEDVPDRFSALAGSLAAWVGNVDLVFSDSSAATAGVRHVRWVTDANCNLMVQRVQLSTTGDDSFSNTVNELKSVGLNRTDRKYLIWVDATLYCGISSLSNDDRPEQTNANNRGPSFARVDSGCWGLSRPTEAHELMHMLGGVQYTAPHTSGGGHCTDDYDRMCYADAQGVQMTYGCSTTGYERLFDCNHDDYFSTNPPAGSYLATHWNTASSSFLEAVAPTAWSGGSTTSSTTASTSSSTSTSTTSTTVAPSTPSTTTTSWSGTLSKKAKSRTYSLISDAGTLTATLSYSKARSMTLTLVRPDGSTIAAQSGASPVRLSTSVAAGTYSLVVSGAGGSYSLTVSNPSP
jgi:hypothetical protein